MLALHVWLFPASAQAWNPDAWNPDAGLVSSWSSRAKVSTSSGYNGEAVIDMDLQSHWQSGACLPSGYVERPELNLLLGTCEAGDCLSSSESNLSGASDADVYTTAKVSGELGEAWFEAILPQAVSLEVIGLQGIAQTEILVSAIVEGVETMVGTYLPGDNYQMVNFDAPPGEISAILLRSAESFHVSEIATLAEPCFEELLLDLRKPRPVGWIDTRHWAGGYALSTSLWASLDGEDWTLLAELSPDTLDLVTTQLEVEEYFRYIRIRHTMDGQDYSKAYVWEIQVYDKNGPYGPMPDPQPQPRSFRELLGVNGIWGWGNNSYTDLLDPAAGPGRYSMLASHARNYHNMSWDVTDPDNIPDYEAMAEGQGTESYWWLDWDREYLAWKEAGLQVEASIQFTTEMFPEDSWDDPWTAGYEYGQAFSRHFGSGSGTGAVSVMEVGNEPWGYSAGF